MELNARTPSGPLAEKWDNHKFSNKLVNPANRRKFKIIVVGTGLAGASASATLAEQGYQVHTFCADRSLEKLLGVKCMSRNALIREANAVRF